MTDYFGYDVHFVMNITDIDDKVCLKNSDLPMHILIYVLKDHQASPSESPTR